MPKPPARVIPPSPVPPPAPPVPLMSERTLTVLRRQINQRRVIDKSIHYLAQNIFKTGTEIKYAISARHYYGRVVEVIGNPGHTQVRVTNMATSKQRDLWLTDIVGILQEA